MATFKVSRGSYAKMKQTTGKNENTLYFGYDQANLMGIFLGDKEMTPTIRDITFTKDTDSNYVDINVFTVNAKGKLVKSVYKVYNTTILEGILSNINTLMSKLLKQINDVSTRLLDKSTALDNKIKVLDTKCNDISTRLKTYYNTTNKNIKNINSSIIRIDSSINGINNSINILNTSVNKNTTIIEELKVQWIDLD